MIDSVWNKLLKQPGSFCRLPHLAPGDRWVHFHSYFVTKKIKLILKHVLELKSMRDRFSHNSVTMNFWFCCCSSPNSQYSRRLNFLKSPHRGKFWKKNSFFFKNGLCRSTSENSSATARLLEVRRRAAAKSKVHYHRIMGKFIAHRFEL